MAAFYFIIFSLLAYPVFGYLFVRFSKNNLKVQKRILFVLCLASGIIISCTIFHVITRSEGLNWFLITLPYLTLSTLLWKTQHYQKLVINVSGKLLMIGIFGTGYLASTIGVLFTLFAAGDLETDQSKWISKDLVFKERNIGQGPDPSVRLKKIEVYKSMDWFPLLAARIEAKTYDTWDIPLQQKLNAVYDKDSQILYLTSLVKGYKKWQWSDTLRLSLPHHH